MYAIVDIETTGSHTAYSRVTEISIFHHDGEKYSEVFNSLIDPGVPVPAYITGLTGITNEMLEKAPSFEQVADKVYELLKGRIFVAHNVNFDFNFLKTEFEREGLELTEKKLCTVRLGRKIIPGLKSYSLGNLCSHIGIRINDRHRAGGDAAATAELLSLLISMDKEGAVSGSLKKNSKEATLPPNLSKDEYQKLPDQCGIYYFHDKKGKVLYVGKAVNIKKRVTSHFTGKSNTTQRQDLINNIHGISWELCGNEFIALLLECNEIRKHWPKFNRQSKKPTSNYGIFEYEDQKGYVRLAINNVRKGFKPLYAFSSYMEARDFISELAKNFELPGYLCGLCTEAPPLLEPAENYNTRLRNAMEPVQASSLLITGPGRHKEENSLVLIDKGEYKGFGYFSNIIPADEVQARDLITPYPDNPDIQRIIKGFIRNPGSGFKIIPLNNSTYYQEA